MTLAPEMTRTTTFNGFLPAQPSTTFEAFTPVPPRGIAPMMYDAGPYAYEHALLPRIERTARAVQAPEPRPQPVVNGGFPTFAEWNRMTTVEQAKIWPQGFSYLAAEQAQSPRTPAPEAIAAQPAAPSLSDTELEALDRLRAANDKHRDDTYQRNARAWLATGTLGSSKAVVFRPGLDALPPPEIATTTTLAQPIPSTPAIEGTARSWMYALPDTELPDRDALVPVVVNPARTPSDQRPTSFVAHPTQPRRIHPVKPERKVRFVYQPGEQPGTSTPDTTQVRQTAPIDTDTRLAAGILQQEHLARRNMAERRGGRIRRIFGSIGASVVMLAGAVLISEGADWTHLLHR